MAEVEAGIEVPVVGFLDDGADHHIQTLGEVTQLANDWIFKPDRAFRDEVLEEIARQTELGKDDKLGARVGRLPHPVAMALEISVAVAECRIHLRQGNGQATILAHASAAWRSLSAGGNRTHCAIAGAIASHAATWTAAPRR